VCIASGELSAAMVYPSLGLRIDGRSAFLVGHIINQVIRMMMMIII
jgi:hypothetical protein